MTSLIKRASRKYSFAVCWFWVAAVVVTVCVIAMTVAVTVAVVFADGDHVMTNAVLDPPPHPLPPFNDEDTCRLL